MRAFVKTIGKLILSGLLSALLLAFVIFADNHFHESKEVPVIFLPLDAFMNWVESSFGTDAVLLIVVFVWVIMTIGGFARLNEVRAERGDHDQKERVDKPRGEAATRATTIARADMLGEAKHMKGQTVREYLAEDELLAGQWETVLTEVAPLGIDLDSPLEDLSLDDMSALAQYLGRKGREAGCLEELVERFFSRALMHASLLLTERTNCPHCQTELLALITPMRALVLLWPRQEWPPDGGIARTDWAARVEGQWLQFVSPHPVVWSDVEGAATCPACEGRLADLGTHCAADLEKIQAMFEEETSRKG